MSRGAKPWKLEEDESFSSFCSWKTNLLYNLKKEDEFKQFLKEDTPVQWEVLTSSNPKRGFTGTGADDKVTSLNSMLGYIASYAPPFLATDIEKNARNVEEIWHYIREYYRFGQSEAQFMKLLSIKKEENERPQRLYQRILAHLQDNLLQKNSKLKHNGATPTKNEDMSPTVERFAVLRWMELIHPKIPTLVQRTFAYDLQRSTLKDLQPQIADALESFLEEIREEEQRSEVRYMCADAYTCEEPEEFEEEELLARAFKTKYPPKHARPSRPFFRGRPSRTTNTNRSSYQHTCIVCKAAGRRFNHSLNDCEYLSIAEKKNTIRSLRLDPELESDLQDE